MGTSSSRPGSARSMDTDFDCPMLQDTGEWYTSPDAQKGTLFSSRSHGELGPVIGSHSLKESWRPASAGAGSGKRSGPNAKLSVPRRPDQPMPSKYRLARSDSNAGNPQNYSRHLKPGVEAGLTSFFDRLDEDD